MRYLALLHGDEDAAAVPGTPELDAEMAGYERFGEEHGSAIVAGEALEPSTAAVTVRSGGGDAPLVTDGPFAETVEAVGGFYVLDVETLDDAIEMARQIPAVRDGGIELRPMVEWFDRSAGAPDASVGADASDAAATGTAGESGTGEGVGRYLALLHGKEDAAAVPGTSAWDAGAAAHARFGEAAGVALRAGGALHPVATATTVRVRDDEVLVTDGPFAESAEVIGGLYVLGPLHRDRAVDLAARMPTDAVELRPIMELG